MPGSAQIAAATLERAALPRILFVLGKGGVGRSTVSAALACALAGLGERVLVLEWAVADVLGPWFARAPAGPTPVELAPGLSAANFTLDEALRAYFVDHLHLGPLYRRVIRAEPVQRLIDVAPGLSEIFFLGELWWLTTLAEREAGYRFDRVVVDAPATGHGASLLDIPETLSRMGATGLLAREVRRVEALMADPRLVGSLVVTLPEPLPAEESAELVPRVTARLGRPPLALVINRNSAGLLDDSRSEREVARLSPAAREVVETLRAELSARGEVESQLSRTLGPQTSHGVVTLAEVLGLPPLGIVQALADALTPRLVGGR